MQDRVPVQEADLETLSSSAVQPGNSAGLGAYGDLEAFSDLDLDDLAIAAASLCRTPIALVSILDGDQLWFSARVGTDQTYGALENSGCAAVIARRAPVVITDMMADPETRRNSLVCGAPGLRFYAGYPLFTAENEIFGTLCVVDLQKRPQGLSQREHDGLAALARQTMRLMELRRETIAQERRLAAQQLRRKRVAREARQAEAERRQAREKYALHQAAGAAGGVGIYEYDLVSGDITVSPEVCRIIGMPVTEVVTAPQWAQRVHEDDKARIPLLSELLDGSAPLKLEYRIVRDDDRKERWVLRQGVLDRDATGRPVRLIGTLQDITPEKNATSRLTTLLAVEDALRAATTRRQALTEACELLGRRLEVQRVGFAAITMRDEVFTIDHGWCSPDVPPISGVFTFQTFRRTSNFLRSGAVLILDDLSNPSWMEEEQEACRALGVEAQIIVPKMDHGELTGCLFVHSATPRDWTLDETSFIRTGSDRIFTALDEWEAEARQEIVNHEILHRLKNTLSIVQSLAHQGFRNVDDQGPLATFTSRLVALSAAHDLLMRRNWQSTDLASLVRGVLTPLGVEERVEVSGPFLKLGPDTATSFSMALHELATNAVKYGALSVPDGKVSLSWTITGAEAVMTLKWRETGGPPVTAPKRTGFGVRLLRSGLGRHGKTELHYASTGLCADLTAPTLSLATL
ncbi:MULTISPECIES: HWE histidine kinase domain-containing protein [Gluconobacter]|uniref:histidine kinase n=1 Tax=Gluconobacter cadivus TaxID=2728101 RepID=A0ABR9YU96_9PROT|nr:MULTISPECIES: HWE histidine kinase domain-containing protein [Gluconobacter]MBF0887945.1 GAF domain-containing protein [Gluconobacter cadivus]MBS1058892.1 GAF domain-containing protein [Gluconobacter sp. Dm-44]